MAASAPVTVAGVFIFQYQRDTAFAGLFRCCVQNLVHRLAKRRLIFQPPEVETAHQLRTKRFGQSNASLQDFISLREGKACTELIALLASVGKGRLRPVFFEKWSRHARDPQNVLINYGRNLSDLTLIECDYVLVP